MSDNQQNTKIKWGERTKKEKRRGIIAIIVVVIALLAIISALSGGGGKSSNVATKQAKYVSELYNVGNSSPTPMTLPADGLDANDGWDTATQASKDAGSTTAVLPAVIVKPPKTLSVDINVKNVGNAPGTPVCIVSASSNTGKNFKGGYFYGSNAVTVTNLNGGAITPGNYGNTTANLSISNNGAGYIKQIKVSCS